MSEAPRRIDSVDGLRGIFACSIMVYHSTMWSFEDYFQSPQGALRILDWLGIYGVEAFFIISAFSMLHVYGQRDFTKRSEWRDFLIKRVARIWPLYVAAVAIATIYRVVIQKEMPQATDLLLNLSLLFGFVDPAKSMIIGGWSIGIEIAFYIVFPLAVIVLQRWKGAVWGLFVGMAALGIGCGLQKLDPAAKLGDPGQWQSYVSPWMHGMMFAAGFVAYELWRTDRIKRYAAPLTWATVLVLGACIVAVCTDQMASVTGWQRVVYWLGCSAICLTGSHLSTQHGWVAKGLHFLGITSYSIYLLHPFVYQGLKLVHLPPWAMTLTTIAITPLMAWFVYRHFERPCVELGKKIVQRLRAHDHSPERVPA